MLKAIIVYGSTTGNTELLASYIGQGINKAGVNVTVRDVTDVDAEELVNYDIILLGSSTWGEGELQDDFLAFYNDMDQITLRGKKAAAFGPGDSSYELFCEAVNLIEAQLRDCGATIIADGLKIDGDVINAEKEAIEWGKRVASAVKTPA